MDDLTAELNKPTQHDSTKVNTLIKLCSFYYGNNPSKMFDYAQQASNLALKIGFKKGLASAYRQSGIAQYTQGNFTEVWTT